MEKKTIAELIPTLTDPKYQELANNLQECVKELKLAATPDGVKTETGKQRYKSSVEFMVTHAHDVTADGPVESLLELYRAFYNEYIAAMQVAAVEVAKAEEVAIHLFDDEYFDGVVDTLINYLEKSLRGSDLYHLHLNDQKPAVGYYGSRFIVHRLEMSIWEEEGDFSIVDYILIEAWEVDTEQPDAYKRTRIIDQA